MTAGKGTVSTEYRMVNLSLHLKGWMLYARYVPLRGTKHIGSTP